MGKTRCIGGSLFCAALLGVAGYFIWKYAGEPTTVEEAKEGFDDLVENARDAWKEKDWDFGDFKNVLGDLLDVDFGTLFADDSFYGKNDTLSWEDAFVDPDNGGLQLTLQNALDETWQEEFDVAVKDWQESDALVLTPEKVAVDHTCQRVKGVMVVCNANFGETGWVGINENSVRNGRIESSVAKMNEHYLRNADFAERRFTMCHELGHGFGLPHTDENPYNANLGNCLDYTDDPKENVLPGEVNMEKLRGMYLTERRRRVLRDGTIVERTRLLRRQSGS